MLGEKKAGVDKAIVAFLGPEATYTHQAALSYFPNPETHTFSPKSSIEDVFAAVQSGTSARGVVPFENSTNGSVVFTLDLLADRNAKYPGLLISGEAYVRVQHCLLGHARHVRNPESSDRDAIPDLSHITKLYSHPQAWTQCTRFLTEHFKHAERHDVSSTSRAAELVAQDATATSAAISSAMAAESSGLGVLVKGIEDNRENTTRFLVLEKNEHGIESTRRHPGAPQQQQQQQQSNPIEVPISESKVHKSLILLYPRTSPDHDDNNVIVSALKVLASHSLSVTNITTRPSGLTNWDRVFLVEVQGTKGSVNPEEAWRELDVVCRGWKWLGSWDDGLAAGPAGAERQ